MKDFKLENRNYDPIIDEENQDSIKKDLEALLDNTSPRLPVILLVDVSASMAFSHLYDGVSPIKEVNKGINELYEYIRNDFTCSKRVELSLITFNDKVTIINDFAPIETKQPCQLTARFGTIMAPALCLAVHKIRERVKEYANHHRSYYRPVIIMLTDGGPGDIDDYLREKEIVHQATANHEFQFFAIKVGEETNKEHNQKHVDLLNGLDAQIPVGGLDPKNFPEFFKWLSKSVSSRSKNANIDDASIPDPSAWWKKLA